MTIDTDSATLTDQPLSTLDTPGGKDTVKKDESALDRLTGTTSDDRTAMFEDAREKLGEAVSSAVAAVKGNPKAAAAIAAGATAAVAGAALGAAKLAKKNDAKRGTSTRTTKRAPRKPATKK